MSGDRSYWDRHAKNYDRSMVLLGRPVPRMLELVVEAVTGHANVLELAAGTGLVTMVVAPRVQHLVAVDYSRSMVDVLRERVAGAGLLNVECAQGDIYALKYPAASFDAVIAANVLHLLPDVDRALSIMKSLLRPAGRLIAPTFCHDQTLASKIASRVIAATGFPSHRRYDAAGLRQAVQLAGLHIRSAETIPGLIPIDFVMAEKGS